ncbi:MAG: glycosyltransferase family 4 protein [Acidobacteriota bacterium]
MGDVSTKKPKIVQIITLSEIGGAQKVVFQIVSGLKDRAQFIVICHPDGELVSWLQDIGIRTIALDCFRREISPINDVKALIQLVRILKAERPDIVHCHSSKAGILGRLAAWLAGVNRILFTVHSWGFNDYQPFILRKSYLIAEKIIARFTDLIICVTNKDLVKGVESGIAPPEKMIVIHNGMDPLTLEGPHNVLRNELGLGDAAILIGSVGRLAEPKEPLAFIEAAKAVISQSTADNVYFVWIGYGPLMEPALARVREYGLSHRIFFVGKKEEAAVICNDFDIFVLLSKWEALPMVLIEAMFQGKPLLCYDVGGISELIIDSINGYIVPYGQIDDIAQHLLDLIREPDRVKMMGNKSKELSVGFTLDKTLDSYNKVFEI